MQDIVNEFLNQRVWAVIGFSLDPTKYGHKVFLRLENEGYTVFPINPKLKEFKNHTVYSDLDTLPIKPDVVITVVPPKITETIVQDCLNQGIHKIWMQPGSEYSVAIELAEKNNIEIIYNRCVLIELNKRKQ